MNGKVKLPASWLFSQDCPTGQVFEGEAIEQAIAEGWVESPDDIEAATPTPAPTPAPKKKLPPSEIIKTETWPQVLDGVFFDINGTTFDPAQHQQKPGEGPTMNKDGSFRKLPGPPKATERNKPWVHPESYAGELYSSLTSPAKAGN